MIEDMTVRNLSPATQQSYLSAVSKEPLAKLHAVGKTNQVRLVRLDGGAESRICIIGTVRLASCTAPTTEPALVKITSDGRSAVRLS